MVYSDQAAEKVAHLSVLQVKCHRSGSRTSHVRSSDIAAHVGGELSDHFGWTVDLKSAELEIVIFICDNSWLAGIPVLRQAQSDRGYIKHTGLHPTVSWALARIGGIQPNDLVCDPMCGKGITLLEASMKWPAGNYLGLDIDTTQLELAQDNITKVRNYSLLHCTICSMLDQARKFNQKARMKISGSALNCTTVSTGGFIGETLEQSL